MMLDDMIADARGRLDGGGSATAAPAAPQPAGLDDMLADARRRLDAAPAAQATPATAPTSVTTDPFAPGVAVPQQGFAGLGTPPPSDVAAPSVFSLNPTPSFDAGQTPAPPFDWQREQNLNEVGLGPSPEWQRAFAAGHAPPTALPPVPPAVPPDDETPSPMTQNPWGDNRTLDEGTLNQMVANARGLADLKRHEEFVAAGGAPTELKNVGKNIVGGLGKTLSFIARMDASAGPMPTMGAYNPTAVWANTTGRQQVTQAGLDAAEQLRQDSQQMQDANPMRTGTGKMVAGLGESIPQLAATVAAPEAAPFIWGVTGAANAFNRAKAAGADDSTAAGESLWGGVIGTLTSFVPGLGKFPSFARQTVQTALAMGAQSAADDVVAKVGHGDKKSWTDVIEDALISGSVGAVFHLIAKGPAELRNAPNRAVARSLGLDPNDPNVVSALGKMRAANQAVANGEMHAPGALAALDNAMTPAEQAAMVDVARAYQGAKAPTQAGTTDDVRNYDPATPDRQLPGWQDAQAAPAAAPLTADLSNDLTLPKGQPAPQTLSGAPGGPTATAQGFPGQTPLRRPTSILDPFGEHDAQQHAPEHVRPAPGDGRQVAATAGGPAPDAPRGPALAADAPTGSAGAGQRAADPRDDAARTQGQESEPQQVPAGAVTGFTTAQGSNYAWDGTSSQRTKSPHLGHDAGDVGLKAPSDRTVFVPPDVAQQIGMHTSLNAEAAPSVTIQGDKIVLRNKYGPGWQKTRVQAFPFTTEPAVGQSPVEFWNGGGVHPGNPITALQGSPPADALYEQAKAAAKATGSVTAMDLMRGLGIGYDRASKLIGRMRTDGLVDPSTRAWLGGNARAPIEAAPAPSPSPAAASPSSPLDQPAPGPEGGRNGLTLRDSIGKAVAKGWDFKAWARSSPRSAATLGDAGPGLYAAAATPDGAAPSPEQPPAAQPASAPPAAAKPKAPPRPFTKPGLQQRISDLYAQQGGGVPEEVHHFAESLPAPYTFYSGGKYQGEVRQIVKEGGKEAAKIRRNKAIGFTTDPAEAGGEDAITAFEDRYGERGADLYWSLVREHAGIGFHDAIEHARNSPDPELQFLAAVHDNLPRGGASKGQKIIAGPDLTTGTRFKINGHDVRVVEDPGGYRVLKDGDDYPVLPVDALPQVPVDKDGFKPAPAAKKTTYFNADEAGVSQQQTGLLGQPVFDGATGRTQGRMQFAHEPVKVAGPPQENVGGKVDLRDDHETGQMFPDAAATPPGQPPKTPPAVAAGGGDDNPVPGARTPLDTPEIVAERERLKGVKPTSEIDTPERRAMRHKIVNELYGDGATAKDMEAYIVIGPPAAGKSSMIAEPLAQKTGSMIVDSDMVKEKLPEFDGGRNAMAVHAESVGIWKEWIARAIDQGDNVVLPVVGSSAPDLSKRLSDLHGAGYTVHLVLANASKDVATQRAIDRWKATGRFVDPDYVYNTVGNKPRQSYDGLRNEGGFDSFSSYSTEVPRGSKPRLLDHTDNAPDVHDLFGEGGDVRLGGGDDGRVGRGDQAGRTPTAGQGEGGTPTAADDDLPDWLADDPAADDEVDRSPGERPMAAPAKGPSKFRTGNKPQPPKTPRPPATPAHLKSDLYGPGTFVAEEVAPRAAALVNTVKEFADQVLSAVAPQVRGGDAARIALALREMMSRRAIMNDRAFEALGRWSKLFDRMSKDASNEFVDRAERGQSQGDATLNVVAKALIGFEDKLGQEIRRVAPGKLAQLVTDKNYLGRIWKDPVKAADVFSRILGKRPLEGSKGFLKKRSIDWFKDGIDAGLVPATYNPVDMALLKGVEVRRFIEMTRALNELKGDGLRKYVGVNDDPPEGWETVDDAAFKVYGPPTITVEEAYDKGVREPLLKLAQDLGVAHDRRTSIGKGAWGLSHTGGNLIETKFGGTDAVIAHELGHQIGDRWDLLKRMTRDDDPAIKTKVGNQRMRVKLGQQLRALADLRHEFSPGATDQFKDYVREGAEKEAAIVQAWVSARDKFRAVAPDLYQRWVSFLNQTPQLKPLLNVEPSMDMGTGTAEKAHGGLLLMGKYYVPAEGAQLFRNMLTPGIRQRSGLVRGYFGLNNVMSQLNLNLSAFHAVGSAINAGTSDMALAFTRLASTSPQKGLAPLGRSLVPLASTVKALADGSRMIREWMKPGSVGGEFADLVKAAVQGGGRVGLDEAFQTRGVANFTKAWRQVAADEGLAKANPILKALVRAPGALTDAIAAPIMKWFVPRIKMGAFASLARRNLEQLGPDAAKEDVRKAMAEAWDSVDNRFGQLVYDNTFWNPMLRDVLQGMTRSVGWNLGDIREAGNGVIRLAHQAGRAATGKGFKLPDASAFGAALLLRVGLMGALITWLYGHKKPKDAKDLYYPQTGDVDADGKPVRLAMPTYMKDVFAWGNHPGDALAAKASPLLSTLADLIRNKDFFGTKIYNEDDSAGQKVKDVGKFMGSQSLPFSVTQWQQMNKQGVSPVKRALSFAGFTQAPKSISMTPAEQQAREIDDAQRPIGSRTKEEAARSQLKHDLTEAVRKDRNDGVRQIQAAVKAGQITPKEADEIARNRSRVSSLAYSVEHMERVADVMKVWNAADADERKDLRQVVLNKINADRKDTPEARQRMFRAVQAAATQPAALAG